ncbi:MAG TPA: glutamate-cysteine ligase family protein, partial [Solirubrobacterales bacterium]|nr:glutamate-cysteine ligase family protein [Solirubrobacterales bacterium]
AAIGDVRITQQERYIKAAELLGGVVYRTPDCALHVHVGMPDPGTAVRACNGLREHLPLLHALGANSAYWHGQDARLASARFVLRRGFPRVEVPRAFRDFADWESGIAETLAAGELPDYTYLWWDVRPHPKLGTVEVRGMDVQSSAAANAAFAALIQALAAREVELPSLSDLQREALEESYYQAGRHGMEARLMVEGGEAIPAREVAVRALEEARPYAADLGGAGALVEIERILAEGNGADRQRRAFAAGGIPAVLEYLATATDVD